MQPRTCALPWLAAWLAGVAFTAAAQGGDVGPNTNATYVKECGACHFPYQPGFLPERSWRQIMLTLDRHFGENAEIRVSEREAVMTYLAAGAADRAPNARSREVMSSLQASEVPLRVTGVLYVGGIHGGFLNPKFLGTPRVKTLADCSVCHPRATDGRYGPRNYVVSDELFRVLSGD